MKPEDLASLEHARTQSDIFVFHRLFFDGLTQRGWAFQAPLINGTDELRLLAARNGLRRLALATGSSLGELVSRAVSLAGGARQQTLSLIGRYKLALLADAALSDGLDILRWGQVEPRLAMLYVIAALDDLPLQASRLHCLDQLARLIPALPLADLSPGLLTMLYRACFRLSYLTTEVRYAAKKRLTEQACHILTQNGIASARCQEAYSGGHPHLVVIGESLFPGHAMYRFYAQSLQELRQHFRVTLMIEASERHQEHAVMADQVIYFEQCTRPVEQWAEQVRRQAPDLIVYPSIGFSFASFVLSLLRLAPLQLASIGHPAPSCSPCIDATLLFEELIVPQEFPHPLFYDQQQLRPAVLNGCTPKRHLKDKNVLPCIGINASVLKLNALFLQSVQEVLSVFSQPCRLCFFPNVAGLEWQGLALHLKQQFPEAEVYSSLDHISYMEKLAECDLVLQSFPFGGANTTVDALIMGIPVVALRGWSLSGQTDYLLLKACGLSELCSDTQADYIKLAVHLLNDPAYAESICHRLQCADQLIHLQKKGRVTFADAISLYWQANFAAGTTRTYE